MLVEWSDSDSASGVDAGKSRKSIDEDFHVPRYYNVMYLKS